MRKDYQEGTVVAQLREKNDIQITGNEIQILTGATQKSDIGIKSKGKIDFLQKAHQYRVVKVDKFK